MKYDFQQLKRLSIFATVVEQGSFAGAATLLGMSRPAVSEQIALLEKQIDTRLLHRTTRKLSLTLDGENLYPYAANINAMYLQATESLDSSKLQGSVRVTTTIDFAMQWLTPKLVEFSRLYPDICVDLITGDDKTDLIADQIDLAIRIGNNTDESLISRPLFKERLKIYASPDYLEKYAVPFKIADTYQHRWVVLPILYADNQLQLWNGTKSFMIKPVQAWKSRSPAVMMAQVASGLGLGLAFPTIAETMVKNNELVNILPEWQGEEMTFSLLYASRRQMPKRVQVLRDFLLGCQNWLTTKIA